ncbi:hypothetical protein SADUNF_Sadunf10G0066500 [Salix dunnii]|uniref:Uncharacterized protein n=1 Tax=Salix dunnii TaxID=1413687 RepID=A0A835JSM2_9ROSI|nr:hypothetical protein SADUNF_Sadunf10G0066500 [Salix dunnii]
MGDSSSLISMLLHELFADADLLNEFPAYKPDPRLPNITLNMVGSQVGRFKHIAEGRLGAHQLKEMEITILFSRAGQSSTGRGILVHLSCAKSFPDRLLSIRQGKGLPCNAVCVIEGLNPEEYGRSSTISKSDNLNIT